jgi:hypothetical protein
MMVSQLINSAGLCRHSKFDHDLCRLRLGNTVVAFQHARDLATGICRNVVESAHGHMSAMGVSRQLGPLPSLAVFTRQPSQLCTMHCGSHPRLFRKPSFSEQRTGYSTNLRLRSRANLAQKGTNIKTGPRYRDYFGCGFVCVE